LRIVILNKEKEGCKKIEDHFLLSKGPEDHQFKHIFVTNAFSY